MKKLLLLFSSLLICVVAHSQLKPPSLLKTFHVEAVKYNLIDIKPENWPCREIRKSASEFVFGQQVFRIVDTVGSSGSLTYLLAEQDGNVDSYELSLTEGPVFNEIRFSGYVFLCTGDSLKETVPVEAPKEAPKVEFTDEGPTLIPRQQIDVHPSFKNGDAKSFSKWVAKNIDYPKDAEAAGVQGCVIVQFTINVEGKVTNVKVMRELHPSLDAEAVRVVSSSPKWSPGKYKKRLIRVTYTCPVVFDLGKSVK